MKKVSEELTKKITTKKINILKADIENAKDKLLHTATTPPKQRENEIGTMAESRRKNEVRNLRNILKDKLATYDLIMRAKDISK